MCGTHTHSLQPLVPCQIGMVFAVAFGLTTGRIPLEFASHFMLLGPTAVSGNALINIGARLYSLRDHFLLNERTSIASLANVAAGLGLVSAYFCWSVSVWMFLCVCYIVVRWRTLNRVVYDAKLWAFIFSNCVFAVLTTNIWIHTGYEPFRVLGAAMQMLCVALYVCVCVGLGQDILLRRFRTQR